MKPKPSSKDIGMLFEGTMMLFFGKTAYQIAEQATNPKYQRSWIKRALKLIIKTVDKIETTIRHKQVLIANIERAYSAVESVDQPTWE